MKKTLVLFSLIFAIGALANEEVPTPDAADTAEQPYSNSEEAIPTHNFVTKELQALGKKCMKTHKAFLDAQNHVKTLESAKASWEAVQPDCEYVEKIMSGISAQGVPTAEATYTDAPNVDLPTAEAPTAELPKDEI